MVWFQSNVMHFGSNCVLKSLDNPECKPNSTNHGKWPAWHGSMLPLPHTTVRHFLLSKSSQTSGTCCGIQRDHPTQSSLPLPPPSSKWALTAAEPAPPLFLSQVLVPQPNFSRDRGINTSQFGNRQSLSQFCQIHARKKSLHPPPFPQPFLSLHFSTYHRINKRHIYFAWLGTEVELKVWVVQQHKAEVSSLKHHKHFKAEKKHLEGVPWKRWSWVKLSSSKYLRWHVRTQSSRRGELCIIYIHSHYSIYQQLSIQGRNIITTSAVSKWESLASCTSDVLNSIPKECHVLGVCRAAIGSAL